jgi:hypothetical protein
MTATPELVQDTFRRLIPVGGPFEVDHPRYRGYAGERVV